MSPGSPQRGSGQAHTGLAPHLSHRLCRHPSWSVEGDAGPRDITFCRVATEQAGHGTGDPPTPSPHVGHGRWLLRAVPAHTASALDRRTGGGSSP